MKRLLTAYGLALLCGIIVNLAILAGAVWVVVQVLKWTGVIQ